MFYKALPQIHIECDPSEMSQSELLLPDCDRFHKAPRSLDHRLSLGSRTQDMEA